MDPKHDEPKLSVDVHRRTTQLNLWMIVAILVFFILGGVWIYRVFRDPPKSTPDMQHGSWETRARWTAGWC